MEQLALKLSDDEAYDRAVHCGTAQASPVTIITKDRATEGGRAGAVLAFEVERNGERFPVQATVTVRNLTTALAALRGRYGDEGTPRG